MNQVKVRKLALCEAYNVVLHPGEPYVFEAIPGCKRCRELLEEANKAYAKDFSFADPKMADLPIYASTVKIRTPSKSTKSKSK